MKRDFTVSAAWTVAASWLEQGVSALVFVVIARLISVEDFGIAAMAFAFLFLGEVLVRDTITEGIIERPALEEGRLEATFVALIGFSIAVVLALVVVAQVAAKIYDHPAVAPLLIAASPTVLMIAIAGVPTALLRRNLAYRALAIRSTAGVVAGGIVGIVMAVNDFGAWSLVGQRLVDIGLNSVFAFKAAGWRPQRWPGRADFALLRGLGPRVVLLRSLTLVIVQTPTVALGVFADPRAAGLFAMAARLVELVNALLVKPLQGVAQSALAAMKRQHQSTAQFYLDLNEVAALVGFAAFAGLGLIAGPVIGILLGSEWRDASPILPVLCVAGAVWVLIAIQEAYLLALDRVQAFLSASLVEVVIGLALVGAAAPFGPMAVAAAVAVRALIALILRTAAALAPEAIPPARLLGALGPPLLVAAIISAAVGVWRIAMLGRIPDIAFVAVAVILGVAAAAALLFGFLPKVVARLKTFLHAEP